MNAELNTNRSNLWKMRQTLPCLLPEPLAYSNRALSGDSLLPLVRVCRFRSATTSLRRIGRHPALPEGPRAAMSSQHPACPRTRVCTFPNKFHTVRDAAHRSRRTSRERMLPSLFSGKQEHAKSSSLVLSTTRALAKITLSLGPTAQRFPQAFLKASCSAAKRAHLQGQSRKNRTARARSSGNILS
jgi:hypothetical protein